MCVCAYVCGGEGGDWNKACGGRSELVFVQ